VTTGCAALEVVATPPDVGLVPDGTLGPPGLGPHETKLSTSITRQAAMGAF
jgi:hypothetical protein